MKRILICLALCLPLAGWAQSELTPEQQLAKARQEAEAAKKAVKEAKKVAKAAKKAQERKSKDAEIQRQIEEAQKEAARYKAEAERLRAQQDAEEARKAAQKAQLKPQVAPEQPQQQVQTGTGGWTVPVAETMEAQEKAKEQKVEKTNEKNAPRYLAGMVPQDQNGSVYFLLDVDVPGKTAQQIYERSNAWLQKICTDDNQIQSRVALTNGETHETVATMSEWLVFQANFISIDRTKMNYLLEAKSTDGHFQLRMSKIKYVYEEGRNSELKISADKWITDKEALNKKGTLRPGSAKFRRGTIDRKDQLFSQITSLLK